MASKWFFIPACILWAVYAKSALAQVSSTPLLLQTGVAGNLVVTIDDSHSMASECLPESLCINNITAGANVGSVYRAPGKDPTGKFWVDTFTTHVATYSNSLLAAQMRSSSKNTAYYDPTRRYLPWKNYDGTRYPNSNTSAAPYDPNVPTGTNKTLNLSATLTMRGIYCTALFNANCTTANIKETFDPAQYYVQTAGTSGQTLTDFSQILINSTDTFTRYPLRLDCTSLANACSQAEERQNFANWFTYYRNKWLVAKAVIAETFGAIPAETRLGYGIISLTGSTVDGDTNGTLVRGVRPFSGTSKRDFYNWLLNLQLQEVAVGTPLRRAMADVGNYYMRSDNAGPWAETPGGNSTAAHLICRRALHMLITDGGWNDSAAPSVKTAPGNASATTVSLAGRNVDGDYRSPFKDSFADTLADVAMYYWKTNLRSDIASNNSIAPIPQEASLDRAATWPHMVNFTIGFGLKGTLSNPDDVNALKLGAGATGGKGWRQPTDEASKVDDLWHAAWNSGGLSFSANDTTQLQGALQSVINSMRQLTSSDAQLVTPSRFVTSGYSYVPSYESQTWTGDIKAYTFDTLTGDRKKKADGGYADSVWSAQAMLGAAKQDPERRAIYTLAATSTPTGNTYTGIDFTYSALTTNGMLSLLNAPNGQEQDLINYLRGNPILEGVRYRSRANAILGDIVNSGPVLVFDGEDNAYDFLPDTSAGATNTLSGANSSYKQFLSYKKKRGAQLFVGANDGMLHAFDASNGRETFAFVPKAVLGSIKALANPFYVHQYFVDGPLSEADVYDTNKPGWRNLVVGTGGAGARNIFAINVPVPSNGNTSTVVAPGPSDILWEVSNTDAGFSDLGKVLQKPTAGLMRDGSWALVVGNGYVDTNGIAKLFVINALTGALIKSIAIPTTGVNGLGGVRLVLDMQRRVTAAYAGDLHGNLWKFDFSSNSVANWGLAYAGAPLYRALDASNKAQPITATPAYVSHPLGGMMVLFGTGKLFESGDQNSTDTQSLYGIWDKVVPGGDTSNANGAVSSASSSGSAAGTPTSAIVQQTVRQVANTDYYEASQNLVDYKDKRGWYINLPSAPEGLRMIFPPQLAIGRVFMQTLSPKPASADPCIPSRGQSLNFVLNPFTGTASRAAPTFDVNGDGKFDSADAQYESNAVNIVAKISGDTGAAAFGQKVGAKPNSRGAITSANEQTAVAGGNTIKRSWRQIISRPTP